MKRIVLIPAAILLWIMQAAAQTGGTVTGILKEKASDLPMEFATVVLHEAETKSVDSATLIQVIAEKFSMRDVGANVTADIPLSTILIGNNALPAISSGG